MSDDDRFQPVPNATSPRQAGPEASATGKLMIGSIDDPSIAVEAMFNPKELDIGRNVPWAKTNEANKSNRRGGGSSKGEQQGIHMEFNGAEGRSLSVELLFDDYEAAAAGGRKGNLKDAVKNLETMASVRVPGANKSAEKRPHHCILVWGTALPKFKCVIESLNVKYTMFSKDGEPLRATCIVKLKEADIVSVAKKK